MVTITKKIQQDLTKPLIALANDLRESGRSDREIEGTILAYMRRKMKDYYKQMSELTGLNDIVGEIATKKDSNAEGIFHELLTEAGIPFKFQYKIGPYRADFLVSDNIVIELDGPQHHQDKQRKSDAIRDRYMKKHGYRILRIPINLVVLDKLAIIKEIKEMSTNGRKA